MATGPFRPGDRVPTTGIYTATHYQHRMPHEVFAVAGEEFPACRRCGSRAYFSILQQAAHIDADQDFIRATAKGKKAKAAKGRKES